eukprot:TRINITY_DN6650_c0_g1_i1.p1 TRINITY_DN6650_c0_g1~~TRINITY_DN6650_c0_g1_i1.p1  ORF type:complete len:288 (+),score=33.87 TRINITY_DN6650_c0_g1_i1:121-984(+)
MNPNESKHLLRSVILYILIISVNICAISAKESLSATVTRTGLVIASTNSTLIMEVRCGNDVLLSKSFYWPVTSANVSLLDQANSSSCVSSLTNGIDETMVFSVYQDGQALDKLVLSESQIFQVLFGTVDFAPRAVFDVRISNLNSLTVRGRSRFTYDIEFKSYGCGDGIISGDEQCEIGGKGCTEECTCDAVTRFYAYNPPKRDCEKLRDTAGIIAAVVVSVALFILCIAIIIYLVQDQKKRKRNVSTMPKPSVSSSTQGRYNTSIPYDQKEQAKEEMEEAEDDSSS